MNEKNKQILLAGGVLAVLLLALVLYLNWQVFGPAKATAEREITSANRDITQLEKDIERFDEFIENDEVRNAMQQRVEEARRRLPESVDAVDFFDIIRESVRRTGTSFSTISPVNVRDEAGYREIPYDITGTARYHDFGQFLNIIECNPDRFMRVNSFEISNNSSRPSLHPVSVQISTFMFRE